MQTVIESQRMNNNPRWMQILKKLERENEESKSPTDRIDRGKTPQQVVGELFLQRALSLIQSKFSEEITMGKTIKKRKLYKLLGRQFSIPKKDIRTVLKILSRCFSSVSLNCHGLKVKPNSEESGD